MRQLIARLRTRFNHDQSCDRASHWTSVACVSTRSGYFAAWIVCLLRVSLNWMSRASLCRRVSFSCQSCVHRLSCVCLMTVRQASRGCLSSDRHRTERRACFAMLDVTRVIWLAARLKKKHKFYIFIVYTRNCYRDFCLL